MQILQGKIAARQAGSRFQAIGQTDSNDCAMSELVSQAQTCAHERTTELRLVITQIRVLTQIRSLRSASHPRRGTGRSANA